MSRAAGERAKIHRRAGEGRVYVDLLRALNPFLIAVITQTPRSLDAPIMSTSFSPTPAELALVNQIFAQGDPQKLGVLTGEVAVRIFGGAKLPPATLGEVWNIADEDNKGWLSKKGVAVAVRLMGWAQKGEKVTKALLNKRECCAVIARVPAR